MKMLFGKILEGMQKMLVMKTDKLTEDVTIRLRECYEILRKNMYWIIRYGRRVIEE